MMVNMHIMCTIYVLNKCKSAVKYDSKSTVNQGQDTKKPKSSSLLWFCQCHHKWGGNSPLGRTKIVHH